MVAVVAATGSGGDIEDGGGDDYCNGLQTGSISRSGQKSMDVAVFVVLRLACAHDVERYVCLVLTVPGGVFTTKEK